MSRIAGIRTELEAVVGDVVGSVKADMEDRQDGASAGAALARISAATQILSLVMQNLQQTDAADQARQDGSDPDAEKTIARLSMGRQALLTHLENLTNDMKS